jgi:hypothetical protein
MGSLLLQNEQIRAVGNMNVNARGDRLDSTNQVIEPKNRQVQRRYTKQTNVSGGPAATSTKEVKQAQLDTPTIPVDPLDTFADLPVDDLTDLPAPIDAQPEAPGGGGLAAAIARQREVKQELEKTRRQQAQAQGVRRI